VVRIRRLADGAMVVERPLLPDGEGLGAVRASAADSRLLAATKDGRLLLVPIRFAIEFRGDERLVSPRIGEPVVLALDPAGCALRAFAAHASEETSTVAAQLADGRLLTLRRTRGENFMTGEVTESEERRELPSPVPARELLLDQEQRNLYAIGEDGRLLWWRLDRRGRSASHARRWSLPRRLIGDRSLVAGATTGPSCRFRPRDEPSPRHILGFEPGRRSGASPLAAQSHLPGPGRRRRARTLTLHHRPNDLAGRVAGRGALPGRLRTQGRRGPARRRRAARRARPRESPPRVRALHLLREDPYEGHEEAAFVWQSTGATDDFEPKLSLTPLLFGTLKATVYSLVVAVPLAVLAAIDTAQFMHPRLQKVVKPTIETMASLPSVVLGFLAGLWLAPRLEGAFPALLLMLFAAPLVSILAGAAWNRLQRLRGRLPEGAEIGWYSPPGCGARDLRPADGSSRRGSCGDFPHGCGNHRRLRAAQRRRGGIAMGFASDPDHLRALRGRARAYRDLVAGSLALGADRWQTVVRVVLPTASPGIFSATMVGFGRAIGETMIVLMATGNTPIMDWNPFSGFRTLSANIAVEIPEAPVGSTLYRTLFVAAILLFAVTFLINTVAELVRQRLRARYARL
jgi:phosphate transport system permease protein